MQISQANAASDLLVRHWRAGTTLASLPTELRPGNRSDGYLIQQQLEQLDTLAGWKIAATSTAGQEHIAVDGPLAGRLLTNMVHADGAVLRLGANRMRVAEAEFAFRMGRDLPPRDTPYDWGEVGAAVETLHLAIEVPDSRYTDFTQVGAAQLIADNACGHQFVLGRGAPGHWRELDLAAHRVVGRVGANEYKGRGANVLGDPRTALVWLVNELSEHGVVLAAGQVVTTGTCVVPMHIDPGDSASADYGDLGSIEVHFA